MCYYIYSSNFIYKELHLLFTLYLLPKQCVPAYFYIILIKINWIFFQVLSWRELMSLSIISQLMCNDDMLIVLAFLCPLTSKNDYFNKTSCLRFNYHFFWCGMVYWENVKLRLEFYAYFYQVCDLRKVTCYFAISCSNLLF